MPAGDCGIHSLMLRMKNTRAQNEKYAIYVRARTNFQRRTRDERARMNIERGKKICSGTPVNRSSSRFKTRLFLRRALMYSTRFAFARLDGSSMDLLTVWRHRAHSHRLSPVILSAHPRRGFFRLLFAQRLVPPAIKPGRN